MISYQKKKYSKKVLKNLYVSMLLPRMIEEKMLILLRQGKISKWFSGIGQEAISVGCTLAMQQEEIIFPMHRNLGVFTSRNIPLHRLFCQWQGKELGFTKGRDRSFHFGTLEYNIVGMISHLGPQLALSSGVALAHKLRNEKNISLVFTGDGGTSEGDFHEALNVASVWQLPVIFVIENNGYGLSTPVSEQYNCKDLADRAKGYGMKSKIIDGNNILEVYDSINTIAKSIRKKPEPWLVEAKTFRMRGHEEASGTKYVPQDLLDHWAIKDPIRNYESFLLDEGIFSESEITKLKEEQKELINTELKVAYDQPAIKQNLKQELDDVYPASNLIVKEPIQSTRKLRLVDAIKEAIDQAMEANDSLILMGQDIADYGGVFKITDGAMEKYGKSRVRNTPLCESAILGIAMGAYMKGISSMVEMQFSDFVTCGFNQIVNNLAKSHYRWGYAANVVIRMPTGGGVGAGPYHSQSTEAWFTHVPGLRVVYPSNPHDAKGLLLAAFATDGPVLFFEHKALYRKIEGVVPENDYHIELGKAKLVSEGNQVSIITYGYGVLWAREVCEKLGISADILDLRSLAPIDYKSIDITVKNTNRVIVLHEDVMMGGIGADISSYISQHLFEHLDAPIIRVASLDTPVPFAVELEEEYLPTKRLEKSLKYIINY